MRNSFVPSVILPVTFVDITKLPLKPCVLASITITSPKICIEMSLVCYVKTDLKCDSLHKPAFRRYLDGVNSMIFLHLSIKYFKYLCGIC